MTRRSFYRLDQHLIARSDPDQTPTQLGEVVKRNSGGRWGLVVDIEGETCTVGYAGTLDELVLPCNCFRRVR